MDDSSESFYKRARRYQSNKSDKDFNARIWKKSHNIFFQVS